MIIKTKYLGYVEAEENSIINFPRGIYGFENTVRYVLLRDRRSDNPFMWMQHTDSSEPCFVVADPQQLNLDYSPVITPTMAGLIGLKSPDALRVIVIATVPKNYRELSLNLKCPVIINSRENIAAQVILEQEEEYPLRYYLFDKERG